MQTIWEAGDDTVLNSRNPHKPTKIQVGSPFKVLQTHTILCIIAMELTTQGFPGGTCSRNRSSPKSAMHLKRFPYQSLYPAALNAGKSENIGPNLLWVGLCLVQAGSDMYNQLNETGKLPKCLSQHQHHFDRTMRVPNKASSCHKKASSTSMPMSNRQLPVAKYEGGAVHSS